MGLLLCKSPASLPTQYTAWTHWAVRPETKTCYLLPVAGRSRCVYTWYPPWRSRGALAGRSLTGLGFRRAVGPLRGLCGPVDRASHCRSAPGRYIGPLLNTLDRQALGPPVPQISSPTMNPPVPLPTNTTTYCHGPVPPLWEPSRKQCAATWRADDQQRPREKPVQQVLHHFSGL